MSEPLTREQIMENLTPECNYLLYGQCQSNGCITRGGWRKGPTEGFEPICHTRQQADTDAALRAKVRELEQECEAYRQGGVTEELLRKGDGYLKIGRGCTVVRSTEWGALTQAHEQAVTERDEAINRALLSKQNEDVLYRKLQQAVTERDEASRGCAIAAKGIVNLDTKLQQAMEALRTITDLVENKRNEGYALSFAWEIHGIAEAVLTTHKEKDKVEHVCGLQGFGRGYGSENDECPACRIRRETHKEQG